MNSITVSPDFFTRKFFHQQGGGGDVPKFRIERFSVARCSDQAFERVGELVIKPFC